ncbi:MAG: GNAT family N-acetyltransferase [Janthinobacterium lividum]
MELRTLTTDDQPAIGRLMAEAFSGGARPEPPTSEPKEVKPNLPQAKLGVFDGSRLVAAAMIDSLHLAWGEADVPLGGIGGVACTADQRGRGHVGRLLSESLRTMYDAGQYLSGLYPFAFAFYRRHGWDWVGEQRQYTVPTSELKAGPGGRCLTAYDGLDALEIVRPVYNTFARRHHGMGLRTETAPGDVAPHWWKRALDHQGNRTTYVQVYSDPETGQAEGYLTFRYPDGGDTGTVGELFANTPAAYCGLLSVLHYYGVQVEKVAFSAPMDDPLSLHLMHWDLDTKIKPLFMGRVVDVVSALTILRPDADLSGKIVLQVSDTQCDWNSQSFAVSIESGHVTVTPTQDTPGVTLDIQTLSQAYWGQPSLDLLRTSGRVSVTDNAQYVLLSRLLPPHICFLRDFF